MTLALSGTGATGDGSYLDQKQTADMEPASGLFMQSDSLLNVSGDPWMEDKRGRSFDPPLLQLALCFRDHQVRRRDEGQLHV
jgi:hypothetical protein